MFVIDIRDTVTRGMILVRKAFSPEQINKKIGIAMVRLFQDHFAKLPHNKRGWPTQNYWGGAAKSTHYEVVPEGVKIAVSQVGVRMHAVGLPSTINPVNAKNLAIPAVPAAYGRRPGEFSNLKVAFRRQGGKLVAFALVEAAVKTPSGRVKQGPHSLKVKALAGRTRGVGKAEQGDVIFWLVKQVHTQRYPNAVPSRTEILQEVTKVVKGEMDRLHYKQE